MARLITRHGTELSTCIVAKANHALGRTGRRPQNIKRCSLRYWTETVTYVGRMYDMSPLQINNAIALYPNYF